MSVKPPGARDCLQINIRPDPDLRTVSREHIQFGENGTVQSAFAFADSEEVIPTNCISPLQIASDTSFNKVIIVA